MQLHSLAARAYRVVRPYGANSARHDFDGLGVVSAGQANESLSSAIDAERAFCVSRLGGVEAKILCWADAIRIQGRGGLKYPVFYWETRDGATNAGIRPRNRRSYRDFARLAGEALALTDVLGVWFADYERAVIRSKSLTCPIVHGRSFAPTFGVDPHWMNAIGKHKLLVITPFEESIKSQLSRMNEIWRARDLQWTAEVDVARFPYLIDDSCQLDWRNVFDVLKQQINRSDASIVVCGCGGLGLLLAAEAKKAGKIGLHLGGFTQLLFGIHGKRHLEQEWHRKYFNDAWIRPLASERAETASRVEGGCYW